MSYQRRLPRLSCQEVAIQLLSRRDHGEKELCTKLTAKGFSSEEVECTLELCRRHHYLDDLRFACSQVRQHAGKLHGELRVRQELRHKGIAEQVVDQALEQEPQDWFELARSAAQKKYKGIRAKDRAGYAKQVRFLQYRGFSFEQITYALGEPDDEY